MYLSLVLLFCLALPPVNIKANSPSLPIANKSTDLLQWSLMIRCFFGFVSSVLIWLTYSHSPGGFSLFLWIVPGLLLCDCSSYPEQRKTKANNHTEGKSASVLSSKTEISKIAFVTITFDHRGFSKETESQFVRFRANRNMQAPFCLDRLMLYQTHQPPILCDRWISSATRKSTLWG